MSLSRRCGPRGAVDVDMSACGDDVEDEADVVRSRSRAADEISTRFAAADDASVVVALGASQRARTRSAGMTLRRRPRERPRWNVIAYARGGCAGQCRRFVTNVAESSKRSCSAHCRKLFRRVKSAAAPGRRFLRASAFVHSFVRSLQARSLVVTLLAPRTSVRSQPLRHVRPLLCLSPLVPPQHAVRARQLHHLQVAFTRGRLASPLDLRNAVRARPLQHLQVAATRGMDANPPVV